MAKVYTAQEMRVRATFEKNVWGDDSTAEMLCQAADLTEKFALLEEAIKVIKDYDLSLIDRFPLDDEDEIIVYAEGENGLGCSYNELSEQQQRVIVQSVNAIRKAQEIIAKAQGVRDGE